MRAFENPEEIFGKVSAETFARVMAQVSDIALMITAADGIVRDVAFGRRDLSSDVLGHLIGKRLIDVVTEESREKVETLLAGSSPDGRWRHLNFPTADGDVPISFQAFGLGGGRTLAVGRDERQSAIVQRRFIAAQRELQESFSRLQQADMRFHTMLELSDLAVLTLNGDSFDILDVNNVAAARVPGNARDLVGKSFLSLIDKRDGAGVDEALSRAATVGRIAAFAARLKNGGECQFQVALFRYENASRLLVRIMDDNTPVGSAASAEYCDALFSNLPHGVVIAGPQMRILDANRAFVDLAQLSVEDNALGQPLERFIGRNGVDTAILASALREHGSVRNFATVLTGAFGGRTEIEVDAVHVGHARQECFGFFIRASESARGRRKVAGATSDSGFAERVTEVVGRVSLKDIVRDTTDEIERLCIETALGMTDNNRAAAAEMLGISRQSLYGKLARYNVDSPGDDAG